MQLEQIGALLVLSGTAWLLGSFMGRWLFHKTDAFAYKMIDSILVGIGLYCVIFTTHVFGALIFMVAHIVWARIRKPNQYNNLDAYLILGGLLAIAIGWLMICSGLKPQ